MRLHVLTNLFPPDVLGGYELLAADVARSLRARGHEVRIVTTGDADRREPGVARILRLARPFGQKPARDRGRHLVAAAVNRVALRREIARSRPDAVLVMSLRRLGLEPLRVYGERHVPAVVTVNDDWPASYANEATRDRSVTQRLLDRGPLARHTWRGVRVRRAVYLSESVRTLVRSSGAPMPEGIVKAQGLDLTAFPAHPFRAIANPPELLFVGRLHPTKAPDVAIDALRVLHARGISARLTLAGAADDAAYQADLRARAASVAPFVTWLGQVPRAELPAVFARADVLLYPLRTDLEAQGLTYLEAMASGVPVVAFPRGGARELLDGHDVTARAATCDGEGFADAVATLAGDVDRQRALVGHGTKFVSEHTSLDRYVDALERELFAARAEQDQDQGEGR
ncbi:MAG TPA: glycosyltransferase family 4 protein [Polyangiaceae bacterium]